MNLTATFPKYTLNELCSFIRDGSHATHKDIDSKYYLLSAKNVINGSLELSEDERTISLKDYQTIYSKYNLSKGDVLLTIVGTLGRCCIIDNPSHIAFQRSVAILRTDKCPSEYLYHYFQTQSFQRDLNRIAVRSAQTGVYLGELGKLRIPLAPEKVQIAIINRLSSTEKKINLLTKKKEALETYKKGLMLKIFSQELRFKREDGTDYPEWKKVTLGSSCKIIRGKGLPKSEISSDGSYKCIHYGELFTFYGEVIPFVESLTDNTDGIPSKSGDILMPSSDVTPNGLMTASMIKEDKVFLGGDINVIRPNETMHQEEYSWDSAFLSFYLNSMPKVLMRLISGTTIKHLYSKDLKGVELFQPTKNEQELYSSLFLSINAKIEIIEKQIFHSQNLKKGLLQQMFV